MTTEDIKTRLAEIDARREAATGPLAIEGWHKSLTGGGWWLKSAGEFVLLVEFSEQEKTECLPEGDAISSGNANARFYAASWSDIGFLRELIDKLMEENAEVWANAEKAIQSVQPELMGELTHYEKRQWYEWSQQAIAALRKK